MSNGQFGDLYSLTTYDGKALFFPSATFAWTSFGNWGAPPTQWITRRGYKQSGVTEIDYLLETRDLPITIWRAPACDRQTYWDNRAELLNFLRPNRGGPLTLTVQTPDGSQFSILVRANPGMVFGPAQANNWDVNEAVEFIAFNPVWFDAAATVLALTASAQLQLVFPITFPISFGTSNLLLTTSTITYLGTWLEYPTITLTGPYTTATITNQATGIVITMAVAIGAGETRRLDLTPGAQSIVDGSGNNRFAELGPGSNLVNFNLRPDPEVPGGVQELTIEMVDGTADSAASLTYRNRYFGI